MQGFKVNRIQKVIGKFFFLVGVEQSYLAVIVFRFVEKSLIFITTAIMFRHVDVEVLASFHIALSALSAIAVFALPELKNAISQSVARGFLGTYRSSVLRAAWLSVLGTSIPISAMLYFHFAENDNQTAPALAMVAIFFPLLSGLDHWRGYVQGKAQFKQLALIEGVTAFLRACSLIVAVLSGFTSSAALLAFIAFSFPALLNLIMTAKYLTSIPVDSDVEPGSVAYGTKSSLYAGVAQFAQQVEKIILFTLSPHSMMLYVAGERWSALMQGLVQDLAATMAPKFARSTNYTKDLDRRLRYLAIGLGAICLSFSFFALPILIPWAFGQAYADAVWVAQLLSIGAVLSFHSSFRFRYIKSKQDLLNYRRVMLLGPALRVILAVPLVYTFESTGAVISVYVGNFIINRMIYVATLEYTNN